MLLEFAPQCGGYRFGHQPGILAHLVGLLRARDHRRHDRVGGAKLQGGGTDVDAMALADGSDAIADWPILNALLNASAGATWVSVHHGGGVGIGYSLHAGMVIVADGSAEADEKLRRVLTCDPGTGVARHADAGYPEAIRTARERGVSIPMLEHTGR